MSKPNEHLNSKCLGHVMIIYRRRGVNSPIDHILLVMEPAIDFTVYWLHFQHFITSRSHVFKESIKKEAHNLLVMLIWENKELPLRIAAKSSKPVVNRKVLILNLLQHHRQHHHFINCWILKQINLSLPHKKKN